MALFIYFAGRNSCYILIHHAHISLLTNESIIFVFQVVLNRSNEEVYTVRDIHN
jgi:hypothetical protein